LPNGVRSIMRRDASTDRIAPHRHSGRQAVESTAGFVEDAGDTLLAARRRSRVPSGAQSIAGIFDEAGGRLDSLLP